MRGKEILQYYSRDEVKEKLLELSADREVVGVFKNGSFDQRPNTLANPGDITTMVKSGVVEFHCSVERWDNPMALKNQNYNQLRRGWDLILDVDCEQTEHGKITAELLLSALRKHGLKDFSLKFSGGSGFHIGIPWESIPREINFQPAEKLFPGLARTVCSYLKEYIREDLEKALLRRWSPEDLAEQTDRNVGDLLSKYTLDPFRVVEIDTVLISSRHLFRMPYSLHGGTYLVSTPLKPEKLEDFKKEQSRPGRVKTEVDFLDTGEENQAQGLVMEALDWKAKQKKKQKKRKRRDFTLKKAVPKRYFPPCIQLILKGLSDGRKRSLFILLNFLSKLKWKYEDIEELVGKWNQKNDSPLRESYVRGQLRYLKRKGKPMLPPNCSNEGYYKDFGVCRPDEICKTIKNPVVYPFRRMGRKKKTKKGRSST